ncbi:MAG TPA: cysteine peptidase family C39 domain-containing protein [Candidatus Omnitrophota bacterium]|nr:cysteine peptidase family C39 domain-containing protein [Candidatus Omnitrophota bacterium]HRZ14076.1 cysteine peptidase family C39 domain-containing protein [Candidatus Omnitrophota bacterium]
MQSLTLFLPGVDSSILARNLEPYTQNGQTSMFGIQNVARQYGLDMYGTQMTYDQLTALNNPAIVHLDLGNGQGHYVTLIGANDSFVTYTDNNHVTRLSREIFEKEWTGFALTCDQPVGVQLSVEQMQEISGAGLDILGAIGGAVNGAAQAAGNFLGGAANAVTAGLNAVATSASSTVSSLSGALTQSVNSWTGLNAGAASRDSASGSTSAVENALSQGGSLLTAALTAAPVTGLGAAGLSLCAGLAGSADKSLPGAHAGSTSIVSGLLALTARDSAPDPSTESDSRAATQTITVGNNSMLLPANAGVEVYGNTIMVIDGANDDKKMMYTVDDQGKLTSGTPVNTADYTWDDVVSGKTSPLAVIQHGVARFTSLVTGDPLPTLQAEHAFHNPESIEIDGQVFYQTAPGETPGAVKVTGADNRTYTVSQSQILNSKGEGFFDLHDVPLLDSVSSWLYGEEEKVTYTENDQVKTGYVHGKELRPVSESIVDMPTQSSTSTIRIGCGIDQNGSMTYWYESPKIEEASLQEQCNEWNKLEDGSVEKTLKGEEILAQADSQSAVRTGVNGALGAFIPAALIIGKIMPGAADTREQQAQLQQVQDYLKAHPEAYQTQEYRNVAGQNIASGWINGLPAPLGINDLRAIPSAFVATDKWDAYLGQGPQAQQVTSASAGQDEKIYFTTDEMREKLPATQDAMSSLTRTEQTYALLDAVSTGAMIVTALTPWPGDEEAAVGSKIAQIGSKAAKLGQVAKLGAAEEALTVAVRSESLLSKAGTLSGCIADTQKGFNAARFVQGAAKSGAVWAGVSAASDIAYSAISGEEIKWDQVARSAKQGFGSGFLFSGVIQGAGIFSKATRLGELANTVQAAPKNYGTLTRWGANTLKIVENYAEVPGKIASDSLTGATTFIGVGPLFHAVGTGLESLGESFLFDENGELNLHWDPHLAQMKGPRGEENLPWYQDMALSAASSPKDTGLWLGTATEIFGATSGVLDPGGEGLVSRWAANTGKYGYLRGSLKTALGTDVRLATSEAAIKTDAELTAAELAARPNWLLDTPRTLDGLYNHVDNAVFFSLLTSGTDAALNNDWTRDNLGITAQDAGILSWIPFMMVPRYTGTVKQNPSYNPLYTSSRIEHDLFHQQNKIGEVVNSIGAELKAQLRSDNKYDFRALIDAAGGTIKTATGSLHIEDDGTMVMIDKRFGADHFGRNENAVYAADIKGARQQLAESGAWKEFSVKEGIATEQDIEQGVLGGKMQDWLNDKTLSQEAREIRQQTAAKLEDEFYTNSLWAKFSFSLKDAVVGSQIGINDLASGLNKAKNDIDAKIAELRKARDAFGEDSREYKKIYEDILDMAETAVTTIGVPELTREMIEEKFGHEFGDVFEVAIKPGISDGQAAELTELNGKGSSKKNRVKPYGMSHAVDKHVLARNEMSAQDMLAKTVEAIERGDCWMVPGQDKVKFMTDFGDGKQVLVSVGANFNPAKNGQSIITVFKAAIDRNNVDDLSRNIGKEFVKVERLPGLDDLEGMVNGLADTLLDPAISSGNNGGSTRAQHEAYHEAGKIAQTIDTLGNEIGAGKRSDGRFDLRARVEKAGGRIQTEHGELRIEADGTLVIIDGRFEADHAGRGENAVYARDEAKARHELAELNAWKQFAKEKGIVTDRDIADGKLGDKLREWMNDKEAGAERQREIAQKAQEFHNEGLRAEGKEPAKKKAVVVLPQSDWNGAFAGSYDHVQALLDRGYDVAHKVVKDMDEAIDFIKQSTLVQKADLLLLGGHGGKQGMEFTDWMDAGRDKVSQIFKKTYAAVQSLEQSLQRLVRENPDLVSADQEKEIEALVGELNSVAGAKWYLEGGVQEFISAVEKTLAGIETQSWEQRLKEIEAPAAQARITQESAMDKLLAQRRVIEDAHREHDAALSEGKSQAEIDAKWQRVLDGYAALKPLEADYFAASESYQAIYARQQSIIQALSALRQMKTDYPVLAEGMKEYLYKTAQMSLDFNNAERLSQISDRLADDALVVLKSCSTGSTAGEGENLADKISAAVSRKVLAPHHDSASFRLKFDDKGAVEDIEYTYHEEPVQESVHFRPSEELKRMLPFILGNVYERDISRDSGTIGNGYVAEKRSADCEAAPGDADFIISSDGPAANLPTVPDKEAQAQGSVLTRIKDAVGGLIGRAQQEPNRQNAFTSILMNNPKSLYDWMHTDTPWGALVEKGWRAQVPYAELMQGVRALVIGDTNHGNNGLQRGFARQMQALKDAGATHAIFEIQSDLKVEDADVIAMRTRLSHRFKQQIKAAQDAGLDVVFMDMPEDMRKKEWTAEEEAVNRGKYMGEYISDFLEKNPGAKAVAITGYAHINDPAQIPQSLQDHGIEHRIVAGISEGQKGWDAFSARSGFSGITRISNSVIASTEPGERSGYIDLKDQGFDVEGIIHFPRNEVEHSGKSGEKNAEMTADSTSLTEIGKESGGQLPSASVRVQYEEKVNDDWRTWRNENEKKIFDFVVNNFDGLNNNQKAQLAMKLYAYAFSRGKRGMEGSVVDIQFVAGRDPYFLIKTVDPGSRPYDPAKDYSSVTEEYEISLEHLQDIFDVKNLFGEIPDNLLEGREIDVQVSSPEAIPKLLPLIVQQKDPAKIKVSQDYDFGPMGVRVQDKNWGWLPMISENEFVFTPVEEAFRKAEGLVKHFNLYSSGAMSYGLGLSASPNLMHDRPWEHIGDSALDRFLNAQEWLGAKAENWVKDRTSSAYRANQILWEIGKIHRPFTEGILKSRIDLRSINRQECESMLEELDRQIDLIGSSIKELDRVAASPLQVVRKAENKEKGQKALEQAKETYNQLLDIRDYIRLQKDLIPENSGRRELQAADDAQNEVDINLAAGGAEKATHTAVNEHVKANLPADLLADKTNIKNYPLAEGCGAAARVIPIEGLLEKTGQLAHIGLGRVYGEAVIYVDAEHAANQRVLEHELYEINAWQEKAKELRQEYSFASESVAEQMREWIRYCPEDAIAFDRETHAKAPAIDDLLPAPEKKPGSEAARERTFEEHYPEELGMSAQSKAELENISRHIPDIVEQMRESMKDAKLSLENVAQLQEIGPYLKENADIILNSCSTGAVTPGDNVNLATEVSKALGDRRTFGAQHSSSSMRIDFSDKGAIDKVNYAVHYDGVMEVRMEGAPVKRDGECFVAGGTAARETIEKDAKTKIAVILTPSSDHNGAFKERDLEEQLKSSGYEVRTKEVNSLTQAVEWIKNSNEPGSIDLLVIGGHGTPRSLQLGNGNDPFAAYRDIRKTVVGPVMKFLAENPGMYSPEQRNEMLRYVRALTKFANSWFFYGNGPEVIGHYGNEMSASFKQTSFKLDKENSERNRIVLTPEQWQAHPLAASLGVYRQRYAALDKELQAEGACAPQTELAFRTVSELTAKAEKSGLNAAEREKLLSACRELYQSLDSMPGYGDLNL